MRVCVCVCILHHRTVPVPSESMASPFSNIRLSAHPTDGGNNNFLSPTEPPNGTMLPPPPIVRRNSELPPGKRQQSPLKLSIPAPRASFSSGCSSGSSGSSDGSAGCRQAVTAPVLGGQLPAFAAASNPHLNEFHHHHHHGAFPEFDTLESPMLQLSPGECIHWVRG